MKKILIIFYAVFFIILCGCGKNVPPKEIVGITIHSLPDQLVYTTIESLNLDGLVVHVIYSDDSFEIINDYEVNYSSLTHGNNVVKISYLEYETEFFVTIKEVEKIKLLEYLDFETSLNNDFDIKQYDYIFDNIAYGVYRDTDMMIVYDEFSFVKTNIYG